jgi:hypothetical protein
MAANYGSQSVEMILFPNESASIGAHRRFPDLLCEGLGKERIRGSRLDGRRAILHPTYELTLFDER